MSFMRTLCLASALLGVAFAQTFTGRVDLDFDQNSPLVKRINDANPVNTKDVGVPKAVVDAGFPISGYDVEYLLLRLRPSADALDIALKCFVVCGDADGNGDPDGTTAALSGLGGIDDPRWSLSESALVALDLNNDGGLDFMIGYPSARASTSDPFPCGDLLFDVTCFGLYRYQNPTAYSQPMYRFVWKANDTELGASPTAHAQDHNPSPSQTRPHIEWTITGLNQLLASSKFPLVDYTGVQPWNLNLLVFVGSFEDDGIGEDFMPGANQIIPVNWPCRAACCGVVDACDVCNGNGRSCLDCKGIANGPNKYDRCDVCGGNGNSCLDCRQVPNGPNRYDVCDVCGGNGRSCLDCRSVPNGPNKYDVCDICAGDGRSCLDCMGVPNGPARYDDCGVCNGDGRACRCDGALLVKNCDWPQILVRSVCVVYNNQELSKEVWLDPFDGSRQVHYFHKVTEEYFGDADSVVASQLRECACGCD